MKVILNLGKLYKHKELLPEIIFLFWDTNIKEELPELRAILKPNKTLEIHSILHYQFPLS